MAVIMLKKKGPIISEEAGKLVEKLVSYILSDIEGELDCGIDAWCEHCLDQYPNYTEEEQKIVQAEFIDIYETILFHPRISYYR